jgi:DNA-binding transcriptional ArsR family regulator
MAKVNSVHKAVAILNLLSDGKERSFSEIARELSLPRSTAHSLLETLTLKICWSGIKAQGLSLWESGSSSWAIVHRQVTILSASLPLFYEA